MTRDMKRLSVICSVICTVMAILSLTIDLVLPPITVFAAFLLGVLVTNAAFNWILTFITS